MNLQLLEISPLKQALGSQDTLRPTRNSDYHYTAIAIQDNGKFYYWAKGVSIEITPTEYEYVTTNPKLYYFSTALRLHCKLKNQNK